MTNNNSTKVIERILDNLDACIYATDIETDEILFMNERMKSEFGLQENVEGQVCWKLLQSGFTERCAFCPKHKLLHDEESVVWEEHNTVTKRFYKNTDKVIDWIDGRKAHIQYSADITDLKRAEERISHAERTLRAVLDSIPIPIFWKDANLAIAGCNKTFAEAHGVAVDDIIGKTDYDILDAESAAFNAQNDRSILESGHVYDSEERVIHGGKEHYYQVVKSKIAEASSDLPIALIGITKDVTEEKKNRRELLRMSSIVENSTAYIAYINDKGMFDYFNPMTTVITGYSREELMEGGIEILYDDATMERVQDEILPAIFNHGQHEFELPLIRKNGDVRIMSFSGFLVGDDEYACATIATDVTERKHLEEQYIREKELAEAASRAKTEFLSRMSHEIRTPMNAIIGMTRIAFSSTDEQKRQYCLEKIDAASTHLLRIINDILDMSKIEADKLELAHQAFDLEKMIMDAVGVVTFLCDEKEQNLIVRLDDSLPQRIVSDEMRLKQVITNLLSNAIKFTPAGGTIVLGAKTTNTENNSSTIRFEVSDNGIGIADTSTLFTAFEQGDGSITRKYGGTGLGLTICKKIVELMGGGISVSSAPECGSCFTFTIVADVDTTAQKPTFQAREVRVLAVDDAEEIRGYFTHVMKSLGVPCDVAPDGPTAIEMVRASAHDQYDIIFVDWKMPGMNGIELTRQLRKLVGDGTIIIMISVFDWNKIEHEAIAAGVNKFVSKPLFSSALLEAINDSPGTAYTPPPSERMIDLRARRILLAEDIEVNQEIIAAMLEGTGATLVCASTGTQAVALCREQKFDLILMDIHMPEMDGFEATAAIRALSDVPIVAMTANVFREDIEKCLACGMNDHIPKPIERDVLIDRLEKYLSDAPLASSAEPPQDAPLDFTVYINAEEGASRVLNNRKLYFKLLGDCKIGEHCEKIVAAIDCHDNDAVIHSAHTLKGIAANLSLPSLRDISADIELRARDGRSVAECVEPLRTTTAATEAAIARLIGGQNNA